MVREGLSEDDKRRLKQDVLKMGLYALRRAKKYAPVDTGRLRASITLADSEGLIQPIGKDALPGDSVEPARKEYTLVLGTNVDYAEHQEYGTQDMAPNPFLRPAVDDAFKKYGYRR